MTRTTQVAIIGGGIMGVAAQYQLAENGWTDTILFEKAELTSGSTWHAAGQIAHAVGSRIAGWINKTSIETYKRVEAETGQSIGWHPVGGFRIATTDDEVDWMRSIMGVGKLLDLPMDLVGPEAVAKVNPFYKVDDLKAERKTLEANHEAELTAEKHRFEVERADRKAELAVEKEKCEALLARLVAKEEMFVTELAKYKAEFRAAMLKSKAKDEEQ